MNITKKIILSAFAGAILFASCSKNEESTTNPTTNPPTTKSCLPVSFIENDTAFAGITYNSDGSINSLTTKSPSEDTSMFKFVYSTNKLVINLNNVPFRTLYLNKNGFADSVLSDLIFAKEVKLNTYNSVGYLIKQKSKIDFMGNVSETENTYTYTNNNLTQMVEINDGDTITHTYTYYSDKTDNIAKYDVENYLFGNSNKNLIKTESENGEVVENYTYTFDSNGNVNIATITDAKGEVTKTKYNWLCK